MRENATYSPGGCSMSAAALKRLSFPFSGIDFVEDVFVTSLDD